MFSRIHSRLGTAGFVVAIVALAAALGGTAWAALPGLNAKQKKEVKKIAKKFAGVPGIPGAPGVVGPAGANGAAGKDGAAGTNGTNGKNGTNGLNGKSVTTGDEATGTSNCEGLGGVWVEVEGSGEKRYVCNGENGASGGGTMTGDWSFAEKEQAGALVSISYPTRLATEPAFNWIGPSGSPTTACPGNYTNPKAEPGNLCFYAAGVVAAGSGPEDEPGGYVNYTADPKSGATVEFAIEAGAEGYGYGSWAVTE